MTDLLPNDSPVLTKKQRQMLRRAEKLSARTAVAQRTTRQRWLLWSGVVIGLGLLTWLVIWVANSPTPAAVVTLPQVTANDWIDGNQDAPLMLIEYSDFQCPACARFQSTLKQLKATFGEQLAIVYRHFPLVEIHHNARLSAQAAEAAGVQGKFWAMHDLLFERQSDWSALPNPTDTFVKYAQELGLDQTSFTADLNSTVVKEKINQHLANALTAGLPGTPAFFLNGQAIQPPATYDGFAAILNTAAGK